MPEIKATNLLTLLAIRVVDNKFWTKVDEQIRKESSRICRNETFAVQAAPSIHLQLLRKRRVCKNNQIEFLDEVFREWSHA